MEQIKTTFSSIFRLSLILSYTFLWACSSSSDGKSPDDTATSSTWGEMKWGEGKWGE